MNLELYMSADNNEKFTNENRMLDSSNVDARNADKDDEASQVKHLKPHEDTEIRKSDFTREKSKKDIDETLNIQDVVSKIRTSKTMFASNESTRTLTDNKDFHLAQAFPQKQPPRVARSAESDKTEKLQKLGRYYLLKEISRSPNGVVYKARHEDLHNRIVALKVMSNVDENPTGDRISRFKQEINYISSLQHPNIVPVYDIDTTESWLYFTMAYVEGCSLAEYIKSRPMSVNHAVRIIIKVAKGIHYANQHGIIHRDIKPSNILLDKHTGEPMIVDFGLAKDIKSDVKITQSGVTLGTPPYMPPEQARGKQELLDSRSDVYSLGATLYELITKRAPFEGETGMQILMKVLNSSAPRPRKFNAGVSPDLEAIIMKCLSKKQSDRYQNSLSLAADLKKYLSGDWVTARQNTPIDRLLTRIYSYRYMIYSILFTMLAFSVFILSGYFRTEIGKSDVRKTWTISDPDVVGQEKRKFRILGNTSNSENTEQDLWLHDEIWINKTTEPFAQSFEQDNYAGMILSQPVASTDFEVEFDLEILPHEDEFPNFSFFLLPDGNVPDVAVYSDPVLKQGYLLTFGADDNLHWVLYRNGIAQTGDSSFVLGAQSYSVRIQVNNGRFNIEVQDKFRQLFTLKFYDDYPLPLKSGGHFGFLTVNTPIVISSMRLSLISPATSELEKPDRLFNLGLYEEARIDYQQKSMFAKGRKNLNLFYSARFKEVLCEKKINKLEPSEVLVELSEFEELSEVEKPENFDYVYLMTLFEQKEYKQFISRLKEILEDNTIPVYIKQKLLYSGYHIASSIFANVYNLNLAFDSLLQKPIWNDFNADEKLLFVGSSPSELYLNLILIRLQDNTLILPESEFEFCVNLLNILINNSIDDEHIKYSSKNLLFLTEIIRSQNQLVSLLKLNGKTVSNMILKHYLNNTLGSQSSEIRNLLNTLKFLVASNNNNLSSMLNNTQNFVTNITFRKGFRINYWFDKLNSFIENSLKTIELRDKTQTQPENVEDR